MTNPQKRNWWKWLWLLLLIGAGGAGWTYYKGKNEEAPPDYKTTPMSRGDIIQTVTANGQLSAVKNVTVGTQVSGIITDIKVDFNAHVTNGQIIAQIDPSTYEQNIEQAQAELANAKAGLEFAQLDAKRNEQLFTSALIAAADNDKTAASLHQAEAVVRTREAALRRAEVDLQRATIYAPIDGVVINRAVDVGQTVAASFNAPVLFNIANDLRSMRIEAMVSEADVGGVQEGQRVNFSVEAYPGRQFRGEVTQVRFAPVTNQNVVNYTTVVEVNNEDLKLRPGMTANASIIAAQVRDVLRIPNSALRFRPPENAIVDGQTNTPPAMATSSGSTNRTGEARGGGGGPGGGEGGGGERPNREEMRRRFENMTPEQIEEFRARRRERGEGGGSGGGRPGGGGGSGRRDGEFALTRKVYIVDTSKDGSSKNLPLKAVTITMGITDGVYTEVKDGLKEGDVVVTGLNIPVKSATAQNAPPGSPFGRSPFGGGGGPGGGGFRPR